MVGSARLSFSAAIFRTKLCILVGEKSTLLCAKFSIRKNQEKFHYSRQRDKKILNIKNIVLHRQTP